MKTKTHTLLNKGLFLLLLALFIPGCIVISFYPLYEKEDLFPNDLLLGQWLDKDSSQWNLDYFYSKKKGKMQTDSLGYEMSLMLKDGKTEKSSFDVHIIRLGGEYYLDFYLDDYEPVENRDDDFMLFDLHLMKVHTFARLKYWGDSALIEWFDSSWLEEQLKENKIRIRHENNGENILLTAKSAELKKFIKKYGHLKDAYGTDLMLYRIPK